MVNALAPTNKDADRATRFLMDCAFSVDMRLPVVIEASCFVSSTGGHSCEAKRRTMRWARCGAGFASLSPASSTPPPDQMDRFGRQVFVMTTRGARRSVSVSIKLWESRAAKSIRSYPCLAASSVLITSKAYYAFAQQHDCFSASARAVEIACSNILEI